MLVQVAGIDRLNTAFLSPLNGFPDTVVQRSYSGIDIRSSPAMTISEGNRSRFVPERTSATDYDCPDDGNCSNLAELTHSVEDRTFLLLARQQPLASDLRFLVTVMRVAHELERSADLMVNVAKTTRRLYPLAIEPKLRGLIDREPIPRY